MFNSAWAPLDRGIQSVRSFARTGDALRRLVLAQPTLYEPTIVEHDLSSIAAAAPTQNDWRVSDHTASVSRIYALYEQFVEELLAQWIEFRSSGTEFAKLPESMKVSYEQGFANMLTLAGDGRFEHLSKETMISEQAKAYAGDLNYRIFPECLTYHTRNFRMDVLAEVSSKCGIDNLQSWLPKSESLQSFFGSKTTIEQVQSRLKDFIQYRNDAAHASVDVSQILGLEALLEFSDFIVALCEAILQKVQLKALDYLIECGRARDVGKISWTKSDKLACTANLEGITLIKGGRIYIRGQSYFGPRVILGLRVEDVDHNQVVIANPIEVGIAVDFKVRTGDTVVFIEPDAIPA